MHVRIKPAPLRGRSVLSGAIISALALGGSVFTALPAHADDSPDFGPNVTIFDPSMKVADINAALQAASNEGEFSQNRHQFFFAPGTYGTDNHSDQPEKATDIINSEIGFYESISGLGASPDDVVINGAIHAEPFRQCEANPWDCQQPGSLNSFWRSMSNLSFNPIQQPVGKDAERPFPSGVTNPHQMRYAVSQAAPLRRIHVKGDLTLFGRVGEAASGGFLANSKVDGKIDSGSQQQWYTRNSSIGSWNGGVWNTMFSGVNGAPATDFGLHQDGSRGDKTTLETTPLSREIPFLYVDGGKYKVFVPKAGRDTKGTDWSTDPSAGTSLPISDFYIAKEKDTAATINAALAAGKNLILTPGVFKLEDSLKINRAGTVVLGLGMASLTPTRGNAAIEVADVPGVKLAAFTVDAGVVNSPVLIKVGPEGARNADPADPTTLSDVFIRVGGPWVGKATTSIVVNTPNTLLDHIWAWRADHGQGVGWTENVGEHGVIVNADDVTATGLFVEHYSKNQVIWNGERGHTVFYQTELPYDPPVQSEWMDGDRKGYASYRVADKVNTHLAQGLGMYSFFNDEVNDGNAIRAESGIQAPKKKDVRFESMTAIFLNGTGGINHVINDIGDRVYRNNMRSQVVSYPAADLVTPTFELKANQAAPGADGTYAKPVTLSLAGGLESAGAKAEYRVSREALLGGGRALKLVNVPGEWTAFAAPLTLEGGSFSVEVRIVDKAGYVIQSLDWSGKVQAAQTPGTPEPSTTTSTTPATPQPSTSTTGPGTVTTPAQPGGTHSAGPSVPNGGATSTAAPVAGTDSGTGSLPVTGASMVSVLAGAVLLLAGGSMVLVLARRKGRRS